MATILDCGPTARDILTRLATPARNRYYYGKLLDVYHLDLEQNYGNMKRWLLNRLTVGTGVLCGLEVMASADKKRVRVGPGVAIDGWGREIIVPANSPGIDPTQPTDDCGNVIGDAVDDTTVTLWVCYHECEAEPSPALVSDCPDRECENGIVRERYRLRITAGAADPPLELSDEACSTIFGEIDSDTTRRAVACEQIDSACTQPDESCVPIALIALDDDGLITDIERCRVRPMVYSNAVLLDLILCLAERVDECCGHVGTAVKAIAKVSGDNQQAIAGDFVKDPLVVRVTEAGNPVANENVTFQVISGGGEIGDGSGSLGQTFAATTKASGTAELPRWRLGNAGTQRVRVSIATGSPSQVAFNARVAVKTPPVVRAIWPANAAKLDPANPNDESAARWRKEPTLQITFSRKMDQTDLTNADQWLRVFAARRAESGTSIQPLSVKYLGPAANPVLAEPGACEEFSLAAGQAGGTFVAADTMVAAVATEEQRFKIVVLMRAAAANIEDADSPPQLLDADFHGTNLSKHPPLPNGVGVLDAIWSATSLISNVPLSVWNAIDDSGAKLPASGDGAPGGSFDSFFSILVKP